MPIKYLDLKYLCKMTASNSCIWYFELLSKWCYQKVTFLHEIKLLRKGNRLGSVNFASEKLFKS